MQKFFTETSGVGGDNPARSESLWAKLKKPKRPLFSSGPCVKPKELCLNRLEYPLEGRSHRSVEGVAMIADLTQSLRTLLEIPDTHWVGLTPGSATGAIEMVLWNILQPDRCTDVLVWDIFSQLWADAIAEQLRLPIRRIVGPVPDVFQQFHDNNDLVLTWCGTTGGVWVHDDHDFLKQRQNQSGLTIVDAASAVLVTAMPWELLDVVTFSWQKGLGGEAGSGIVVLGPKALERLHAYTPTWPIPRLMRMKDDQGIMPSIFRGEMINTCSMLLMAEYRALVDIWMQRGGLSGALRQTERNFQAVQDWVQDHPEIEFSVAYAPCRAQGPVTLSIKNPVFRSKSVSEQWAILQKLSTFLAENRAGFDVLNHARAFPALRLWCGPAVETQDLEDLFPWIDEGLQKIFQRF